MQSDLEKQTAKTDQKKTIIKRLRLTKSEWEAIQEKMKENNQRKFSLFALDSMIHAKKRGRPQKGKGEKDKLFYELHKIGNNINQIARYANTHKILDDYILVSLSKIEKQLEGLVKDDNQIL